MSDISHASLKNSINSINYEADEESIHQSVGTMNESSVAVTAADSHRVTEEMKQTIKKE